MSQFTCYLAGPISGLSYGESTDWRKWASERLAELSDGRIAALSPMRNKEYLRSETDLHKLGYHGNAMSCARGITTRDRFDCMRADAILCNLLGAKTVSIGTVMEIAWSDAFRKPLVVAMELTGNLHDHGMLNEATGFRVEQLDEACEIIAKVLLP